MEFDLEKWCLSGKVTLQSNSVPWIHAIWTATTWSSSVALTAVHPQ